MMMNIILINLYILQWISDDLMNHKNDQVLEYTRQNKD